MFILSGMLGQSLHLMFGLIRGFAFQPTSLSLTPSLWASRLQCFNLRTTKLRLSNPNSQKSGKTVGPTKWRKGSNCLDQSAYTSFLYLKYFLTCVSIQYTYSTRIYVHTHAYRNDGLLIKCHGSNSMDLIF